MDPIRAALEILPWWVGWGALLALVPLGFVLGWVVTALVGWVAAIPLRRARPSHWVERARLVHPVRVASAVCMVALPTCLWGLSNGAIGPLARPSPSVVVVGLAAAGLAAGLVVRSRTEARFRQKRFAWRQRLRHGLGSGLVLMPHLIVALALAMILPWHWDGTALAVLAAGTVLLFVAPLGGGLWLARMLGVAHPASERLARAVQDAGTRVGLAPRATLELELGRAGAFALPLAKRLIFTVTAVQLLQDEELAAIAAHELGHLREPTRVGIGRLSALLALLALATGPMVVVSWGWWLYAALLLGVVLVLRLVRLLGRRMEEQADAVARRSEPDRGAYARALEKLYSRNLVPAVMAGKRQLHPHLYDRLIAAGAQPGYLRPAPPPRWPVVAALLTLAVTIAIAVTAAGSVREAMARRGASSEPWLLVATALDGGSSGGLAELARLREEQGRPDEAAVLWRAAAACGFPPPEP
jgi:Zn-dependent protease with chaperone function